jgi:hypothetical protein
VVVSVHFVIGSVRKLLDVPSYTVRMGVGLELVQESVEWRTLVLVGLMM